jgi:general stress protein 26
LRLIPPDKAWWDSADDPAIRVIIVEPDDAEIGRARTA